MKSRAIACAIAASLSLGAMSFAHAYDNEDTTRGGRTDGQQGYEQQQRAQPQRGAQRGTDQRRYDQRGYDQRQMGNRESRYEQNRDHERYYGARGPEWRRGGYVPQEYRGRQYVVNDWRGHHLNAPPRGYQWVQVGGDYVLMAIATGIIAQLLLNN